MRLIICFIIKTKKTSVVCSQTYQRIAMCIRALMCVNAVHFDFHASLFAENKKNALRVQMFPI